MNLQVNCVLSASSVTQAIAHMHHHPEIDIVFFDLADGSINSHELLQVANELGNVQTLVIYSELQTDLYRSVRQMDSLSGIRLLGVLDKPLQMEALQRLLSCCRRQQYATAEPFVTEAELIPEEQVRQGLATKAFLAWYQPKFNLRDGQLFGAEVLVRWHHPTRGLLLPRDLLAAVVAYDLLDEMFKQLLDQGIALLGRLRKQGIELGLAFNLTVSQLVRNELVEHIVQTLHQYGVSGSTLMFEVSENSLLDLPASALENLQRLHQMGCGLSIDDFGTGFSSLRLLAQLPFDQLKLDGLFVQDLNDPSNRALVLSSLALARTLRMDLVIEGIGSSQILEQLIDLGCTFGQGFHLALPMVGTDFIDWLERYRKRRALVSFPGR
ncbi:TPA: EAL domain-containing response regulator [Pseudomonas aeruginosa]|uniref:EAL domain-containing response regulator n=1 Tax=Pseudomonas aeruginosa TaxID=287 RepID=UPI0025B367FC|nr:EAL domain-containing response regulator [Pseudomonas aeruginosa]MDN3852927.1 EAL domain-containing response regulator [Pseudomonas aeruginosa]MDY1462737.1 EAL domain-containing response regulator [Pseudomonas aeruginosa]HBO5669961.1 EAL domain-containing protein [Pseudomonas aeruginosa]HBP1972610.1 EAL domain-containing protein [Pseudomonas aeruginosa]HCP6244620.1 EAL domain-containing response regulator [Pseudomonas aeruginosa]